MKVIIMAGGKGTRISSVNKKIPKPMIEIDGIPVLHHQISCLQKQGYTDITLMVGHLAPIIQNYFRNGSDMNVKISYCTEKTPLGTAGGLYLLKKYITDDFILLNGDILFDIDFNRMLNYHKAKNCIATLFTHPNSHPFDSGIIVTDKESRIVQWLHKEDKRDCYKNRVNAGIHMFSPEILNYFQEEKAVDLDRDILEPLVQKGKIFAYDSPEYVKDMGTPERYHSVCNDYRSTIVATKNLILKQKAVFLDRDGTINTLKGFITNPGEIELLPNVAEAIKKINSSGYLAIVISNQPVIARGDCTIEELDNIHNKIETILGTSGAYLDDIFYCPHHPDKGFSGEIIEYKTECNCRKPKAGLIFEASKKYNIDLKLSYMVGDRSTDVEAAVNAGCIPVLLSNNTNLKIPTEALLYQNLLEFVKQNI